VLINVIYMLEIMNTKYKLDTLFSETNLEILKRDICWNIAEILTNFTTHVQSYFLH
jgi:hypothetical protein